MDHRPRQGDAVARAHNPEVHRCRVAVVGHVAEVVWTECHECSDSDDPPGERFRTVNGPVTCPTCLAAP